MLLVPGGTDPRAVTDSELCWESSSPAGAQSLRADSRGEGCDKSVSSVTRAAGHCLGHSFTLGQRQNTPPL